MATFVDKLSAEQKSRASLIASELKKLGITNKYVVAGILAVVSKESDFNRLKEQGYQNTSNARIKAILVVIGQLGYTVDFINERIPSVHQFNNFFFVGLNHFGVTLKLLFLCHK